jgi:hypothetical protein
LYDIVQGRWKRKAEEVHGEKGYTCGFCGVWCESWDRREGHIAGHFKDGATMEGWTDPEVWERKKSGSGTQMEDNVAVRMEKGKGKCKKEKASKEKEKASKEKKKDDTHVSGLARLSRTFSFSRRSTRNFDAPIHAHTQPSTTFANSFDPIPTTLPMGMGTAISYPLNNTYSTAPVLPNINIDPLMPMDVDIGYGNLIGWPQYSPGNVGLGMTMTEDMNTQFGTDYDPDLEMALAGYEPMASNPDCGNGWGRG